jgi:hypothetical protein
MARCHLVATCIGLKAEAPLTRFTAGVLAASSTGDFLHFAYAKAQP